MDSRREDRIYELRQALADLDPARWASFLEAACHDDVALREEVLRRQRQLEPSEGSRSRQPLILVATDQTETRDALLSGSSSGELVPGAEIDSYRVLRKLGSGGMGSVYTGIHTQIERLVAIKVLTSPLKTTAA